MSTPASLTEGSETLHSTIIVPAHAFVPWVLAKTGLEPQKLLPVVVAFKWVEVTGLVLPAPIMGRMGHRREACRGPAGAMRMGHLGSNGMNSDKSENLRTLYMEGEKHSIGSSHTPDPDSQDPLKEDRDMDDNQRWGGF